MNSLFELKSLIPYIPPLLVGIILCAIYIKVVSPKIKLWLWKPSPSDKIFASYSREDEALVVAAGELYNAAGDEFVRDITHIKGGDNWKPKIEELIRNSKKLMLFWSENARNSQSVEEEWRYALSLKREKFIHGVYWEKKLPPLPVELKDFEIKRLDPDNLRLIPPKGNLETARSLPVIFILGFVLSILGAMVLTYLGVRELQMMFLTDEISYEELYEKVPPLKIEDDKFEPNWTDSESLEEIPRNVLPNDEINQSFPEKLEEIIPKSSNTPNPTKVLEDKSALPKLTNPNLKSLPTSCLNSDSGANDSNSVNIFSFKVRSDSDIKNGVPDDQDKIFEVGEQLYLEWGVGYEKSIKIKPFIADLCRYDSKLGITPDKTTTYVLEAVGFDGRVVTKEITVKVKEKTSPTSNLQPEINFEVRDLTENEIIDFVYSKESRDLGRICYKISNAKKASISPSIGEVAVDKSEKCVYMPMGKIGNVTFTLNVTSLVNKTVIQEKKFEYPDMSKSPPVIYDISLKKKDSSDFICYKVKNIRYIAIEHFTNLTRISAKVRPNDNEEYCTKYDPSLGEKIRFVFLGLRDSSWSSKPYEIPNTSKR